MSRVTNQYRQGKLDTLSVAARLKAFVSCLHEAERPGIDESVSFIGQQEMKSQPPFLFMKIGRTTGDPKKEVSALQRGNGYRLALVDAVPGGAGLEAMCHLLFRRNWERGEFFWTDRLNWEFVLDLKALGIRDAVKELRPKLGYCISGAALEAEEEFARAVIDILGTMRYRYTVAMAGRADQVCLREKWDVKIFGDDWGVRSVLTCEPPGAPVHLFDSSPVSGDFRWCN